MFLSILRNLVVVPLLLCISLLAYADNDDKTVIVFGDSLSDTGNLASVRGDFPFPYSNNRVTNGDVAVQVLAARLGSELKTSLHLLGLNNGNNYAVAAARAGGSAPIDLQNQLLAFQANTNFVLPDDALYVIFIGGNDVRDALYTGIPEQRRSIINNAVQRIQQTLHVLQQGGAEHFLVINVPNIAQIPETRLIAAATANPDLIQLAENLSREMNSKLHHALKSLKHKHNIELTEFDLFTFFDQVMANPEKYGFSNSQAPCFYSSTGQFNPDCNFGANFDNFVFFDEIHPTAKLHGIFARAFYQALQDEKKEEKEKEHE